MMYLYQTGRSLQLNDFSIVKRKKEPGEDYIIAEILCSDKCYHKGATLTWSPEYVKGVLTEEQAQKLINSPDKLSTVREEFPELFL